MNNLEAGIVVDLATAAVQDVISGLVRRADLAPHDRMKFITVALALAMLESKARAIRLLDPTVARTMDELVGQMEAADKQSLAEVQAFARGGRQAR